jgi:DMSO/TMAO reductase YedYZ molybdopterin-dependent catalytic subunit
VLAAAVAMGVAQLIAGLSVPAASPVLAVGQAAIDATPLWLKDWATATFGTHDKTVLLTGVVVVVFLYAALVGVVSMRRLGAGYLGLTAFACLGVAAALTRPGAAAGWALPTIVGALAGAYALRRLVFAARAATVADAESRAERAAWADPATMPPIVFGPRDTADAGTADDGQPPGETGGMTDQGWHDEPELRAPDLPVAGRPGLPAQPALPGEVRPPEPPGGNVPPFRAGPPLGTAGAGSPARRAFLLTAGAAVAVAAVGEVAGRTLATRRNVSAAQRALRLPRPAEPAPPLPAGVNLPVPGITPFVTPNGEFYRIDTALLVPQVDPAGWQLRIHGMVAREVVVTFDELIRRPLIEHYLTLCCVSNPVGGPLIGNAKWLGPKLADLIREAGPLRGADQLIATSVDGFTSGTPIEVVLDGRDALVAVAMNGAALPVDHGFPARLVVPGLYGYVSACKWVVDIEVTTFASSVAYWAQRGWSQQAPVKTECRIDVPSSGTSLKAGRVAIAGVAWAQHRGIEAVEVRVAGGPWHQATLATLAGIDSWRQWSWQWDAAPGGPYIIEARATDKTGYTQTSLPQPVAPNGATGYPAAQVTVT